MLDLICMVSVELRGTESKRRIKQKNYIQRDSNPQRSAPQLQTGTSDHPANALTDERLCFKILQNVCT